VPHPCTTVFSRHPCRPAPAAAVVGHPQRAGPARPGPAAAGLLAQAAMAALVDIAAPASMALAGLVARSGGIAYDTAIDITWLTDWNDAQTSGHDADGQVNWSAAMGWADDLVLGGYDDWRLPTIGQPASNCSFNQRRVASQPMSAPAARPWGSRTSSTTTWGRRPARTPCRR